MQRSRYNQNIYFLPILTKLISKLVNYSLMFIKMSEKKKNLLNCLNYENVKD